MRLQIISKKNSLYALYGTIALFVLSLIPFGGNILFLVTIILSVFGVFETIAGIPLVYVPLFTTAFIVSAIINTVAIRKWKLRVS